MSELNDQFKIVDYLASKGIQPAGQKAGEILYYSPLKAERSPSFFVNPTKNRFNDFSTGEKGDIFRLVSLLEKTDFKTSLRLLQNLKNVPAFSFSGTTDLQSGKVKILNVLPITKEVLKQYVQSRGIDLDLGSELENRLIDYYADNTGAENCYQKYYHVLLQRSLRLIGQFTYLSEKKNTNFYRDMVPDTIGRARRALESLSGFPSIRQAISQALSS